MDKQSAISRAGRMFVTIGQFASTVPNFRGKTRMLLGLYRLLRLQGQHVKVAAQLRRPVRYAAELDLHSWLQRVAFLSGGYEVDTVEFLLRLYDATGRRGYLLDVGANIGLITIPFAVKAKNHDLVAVAVEAVPDNASALQENVARNDLSASVRVLPVGLGERSRRVEIQVEGDLNSGEGTGTANVLPENSEYLCVRQTLDIKTLDELMVAAEIPSGCAVVKIDTDGYDLKVLQGGAQFLNRERPIIFGEFAAHCLRWHGQSLADVVTFAASHGYHTWKRVGRTWTFESVTPETPFDQDLLLVPQERVVDYEFLLALRR